MELEVGKFYKTRGGDKVRVAKIIDDVAYTDKGGILWPDSGRVSRHADNKSSEDIISEWTDGPIRTVTRREIVPGTYGCVNVLSSSRRCVLVQLVNEIVSSTTKSIGLNAEELREAAHTFNQLAEALEDKP